MTLRKAERFVKTKRICGKSHHQQNLEGRIFLGLVLLSKLIFQNSINLQSIVKISKSDSDDHYPHGLIVP